VDYKDLLYTFDDGVARITLNRPEKLNALSWSTWAEIETAFIAAEDDDNVRAVLLSGAGRGFCAGSDLTSTLPESEYQLRPYRGREGKMRTRFLGTATVHACRKPTIAAVHGVCVGAGFSLALACDLRVAALDARFSAIFVKRGITADTGATWFLPRTVGMERALEMMWTGRMVSGEEAARIGLVGEAVPADQLEARALELARQVANGPSLAIELMKRLAYEGLDRDLETQIQQEQFLQAATAGSEDAKEGRLSFLEKREPVFRGR
jgi:2-(1,2-epoxy-1,2-dihydrophenyl)acetyl-CoA isomerase